jgi:hypothetical protein
MAELRVRRDDLASCEVVEGESPTDDLRDGEARLLIERFSLSTNNITYAALGEELGYWRIFPTPEGWGRIPAWGYARTVGSRSPELAEGQHVFGLVPMASYVTVRPAPHRFGFVDAMPHREGLSPVYNRYISVPSTGDDAELIMRPLFGTSVLLHLKLTETAFFGSETVVLTSASAKTAYGLAYLLREEPVATIGLTSAARRAWVDDLGLYDQVLAYEELPGLDRSGDLLVVDFAGDRQLLRDLHQRSGEKLKHSISVGFTHREGSSEVTASPGPEPEFFFAPDEMQGRGRELAQSYAEAWPGFAQVLDKSLQIEQLTSGDELLRAYRDLLEGRSEPRTGYVVSLGSA